MSPDGQTRGPNVTAASNIYTIVLGLAFCAVLITAMLVAYKCFSQYGTIFNIP